MLRTLFILAAIITVGIALMGSAYAADQTATGPANPERIVIGLDMSTSNPLVADPDHASKVAARVAEKIRGLSVRSEVIIRTFGVYGSAANDKLRIDTRISRNSPPDAFAEKVERLIKGIPGFVESGKLEAQPYTNIIAFLETMDVTVNCGDMPTSYILLTDGVEDSEYASLRKAGSMLPASNLHVGRPKCQSLTMLGIGKGLNSPPETTRLRQVWSLWAEEGHNSPFKEFVGLNDW